MTAIHPADDNGVDLGSASYSYKDLYVDGTANINTVQAANFIPTGIGDKFIEITIEGVYGDGEVSYDLDAALGSNKEWYHITPLHITEWDGNSEYFAIQLSTYDPNSRSYGAYNIMKQSSYSGPQIQTGGGMYSHSSSNQHTLKVQCHGRSATSGAVALASII